MDSSLRDSIKRASNANNQGKSSGLVASYSNRQRAGNASIKPAGDSIHKKSQKTTNIRKSKFVKKNNFKQNSSYNQSKNKTERNQGSPIPNQNKDLKQNHKTQRKVEQKSSYELNDDAVIAYNKFVQRNLKRKGSATSSRSGRKRACTVDRNRPYGFRIADMSKDTS